MKNSRIFNFPAMILDFLEKKIENDILDENENGILEIPEIRFRFIK